MFKTFQGTNPTGESLAGYEPTVGWVVINDGAGPLTFAFDLIPDADFTINPGEMMRLPIPLADATIDGASRYRALSFGLASLFHEFTRELPGRLLVSTPPAPTGSISSADLENSQGAAASEGDADLVTNAPLVGVQVNLGSGATKYWKADRAYRLFQLFLNKTGDSGMEGVNTLDISHKPVGGGYTSIVNGPRALDVIANGCSALDFLTVQDLELGDLLKFEAAGDNSSCNLHLLLIPIVS